jgi:hypothetical protein
MNRLGDASWAPALDAVALGIAQTDYGKDAVALVSVSAARQHGAIPRAIGVAVVAVPRQRPPLETPFGRVVFTKRDTAALDLQRVTTELAEGWVTTHEQTMLDLAARPDLGGLPRNQVDEAIRALAHRADQELVQNLALDQHHPAALRTIRTLIAEAERA